MPHRSYGVSEMKEISKLCNFFTYTLTNICDGGNRDKIICDFCHPPFPTLRRNSSGHVYRSSFTRAGASSSSTARYGTVGAIWVTTPLQSRQARDAEPSDPPPDSFVSVSPARPNEWAQMAQRPTASLAEG